MITWKESHPVSVPGSFPCWLYDSEWIIKITRSLFPYTLIYSGQNAGEKKRAVCLGRAEIVKRENVNKLLQIPEVLLL